jgi:NitT/TauT family transport system substrate-binding protein
MGAAIVLLAAFAASDGNAATKITLGYTPVPETVGAYAAKEEGYFAKRGLDVNFLLVGSSAVLVTSLVSQSVDIGSITPAVFLQAIDGGLDLVVVCGGAISTHAQHTSGVLARTGETITKPADFIGKKVAVVALRSALQIQFSKWLSDSGVDPKKVTFVEAPYATHLDLLRGGSVDAVVNSDPFISRIVNAKAGKLVTYLSDRLPESTATVIYVATRDWTKAHPDAVKAFCPAVAEGIPFTEANPDKTHAYIAKYLKLPPDAVQATAVGKLQASFTGSQLNWWVDAMLSQGLIRKHINTAPLVVQ